MWLRLIFFIGLHFLALSSAFVDPELLKPCFERYEDHKLIHAHPFHSEWKIKEEAGCLAFCAKSTSRCRSIVYDKMAHICHYFMVDGVELKRVIPQKNMAYFQLADMDCAAKALEEEIPDTVIEEPEPEQTELKEETGPGNVPIVFAPESFPQPPESNTADPEEKSKKQNKFDEKIEKMGPDETVFYEDGGETVEQKQGETDDKIDSEDNLSDVRVPQEQDENEDYKIFDKEPEQENPEPVENQENRSDGDNAESFTASIPPTPVEEETLSAPMNEETEDPKELEIKKIKEEMERLEEEMKQMKEVEKQIQLEPTVFSLNSKFNPKLKLPKLPPTPAQIMEDISPSIVPELKGFKAIKKQLPSSIEEDIKASIDIRRHPSSVDEMVKAYANSVNGAEKVTEDEDCPNDSNSIWIAVENSDLPRIGKFMTKKAQKADECIRTCKDLSINGRYCNSFVFYESRSECSFGHEDEIFSVKPSKKNDFSTRAFKRLCFSDSLSAFSNCGDFLSFRDYKMNTDPVEIFTGLPSGREGVSACVELCVLSSKYQCKSASFDFSTGTCSTFDQNSLSASDSFKSHMSDSLLYFENGCNFDEPVNFDPQSASVYRIDLVKEKPLEPVVLEYRTLKT
ncbi:hypothetical protein FO519_005719 [Halicephalobus sp. NKZ332]|nr:hypothetical protein FO519_005719 [Halicephalobus sp. NKZ332]